ncbi:hypothetical protein [Streptomyces rhizosphaerihabitans]|uniref:hypothetical protein n=1 Tax=Streptomyces rhizosphaerihabitans TaxID=1266770 RepID=UPI0021BE96D8|nr:hypothetical protein [Streptomyces rhizosphaerihabitans]MCT9007119.1 hypothetical protein [Streptomyces rhizosphaerihabitans]
MTQRSLRDLLDELDTDKVSIDESGRIRSSDPNVEARLNELRDLLDVKKLARMDDSNGSMCHCTVPPPPMQSGCALQ